MRYTPKVFVEQYVSDAILETLKPQIEQALYAYTSSNSMVATAYQLAVRAKGNQASITVIGLGDPLGYFGPDDRVSYQMTRVIMPGVRR